MFSVAIAVTFVMLFFTDLGLSNTFLREGAKDGADLEKILSSYIKIRMILLIFISIIGYIVIHYMYADKNLIYMMINVMFFMLIGLTWQNIGIAYFQLTERMKYIALIKVVSASVVIIITCFLYFRRVTGVCNGSLICFWVYDRWFIQYIYHEKKDENEYESRNS